MQRGKEVQSRLAAVCPVALGAGFVALTLAWVVAAVLMSTRGFDITDEGYYVLSYRDWDTNLRTFTGSQYVYGPVFDLVGQSVPRLRLVRLGTVLLAHAAFAWAFMAWLRTRPSGARLTTQWSWVGGLAIVASGGIIYGWLPLSPGYNDVSVLGSLTLMACVLRVARAREVAGRLPLGPVAIMGPVMVAILLAKSVAALPTLLFMTAVLGFVVARGDGRGRGRRVGGATLVLVASVAVSLLAVNTFVMPFSRMLPPMREVNSLVAAGTNSPVRLLTMYAVGSRELLVHAALLLLLPVALLILGAFILRTRWRGAGWVLLVAAAPTGLVLAWPDTAGLPPAGSRAVLGYAAALVAMALVVAALLSAAATRRPRPTAASARGVVLPVAIAVLPAVQALGTGNDLYVMAVNQVPCWAALLVLATAAVAHRPAVLVPVVSAAVSFTVVAAATGTGGLLLHPYRTDPFAAATTAIGGRGVLAGLQVSPNRARGLDDLLAHVPAAGGGRPVVLAFDEMPGLVLLLDARTPGEAWYSATDRPRTAAGIEASCALLRDAAGGSPVAIFNRPPATSDVAALRHCGIVLTDDPARARLVGQPELLVYSTTRS